MERIQSINPQRIQWCCTDHGITPSMLAAEVGIKPERMDKLMAREDGITFNQLDSLAKYFGRGALFFLEPTPVDEAKLRTTAFRTLANQKPELSGKLKTLIERTERQREIYLSLLEDLDASLHPVFAPPTLPTHSPRDAAKLARTWLELGEENSFDDYRAAVETKGVLVFRSNGYTGKWQIAKENPVLGFALYDETCPVIVVKKQASNTQQSFTLMHELGHLLLHKISSIDDDQDFHSHQTKEKEANAFAGHLLVPDHFLLQINQAEMPARVDGYDGWLFPYGKRWGVSTEVILRRLLDGGRLSPNQYSAYRAWRADVYTSTENSGSREYRYREPKHVFGDAYVRTVLGALSADHITLARASRYLDGLNINDVRKLESHIASV